MDAVALSIRHPILSLPVVALLVAGQGGGQVESPRGGSDFAEAALVAWHRPFLLLLNLLVRRLSKCQLQRGASWSRPYLLPLELLQLPPAAGWLLQRGKASRARSWGPVSMSRYASAYCNLQIGWLPSSLPLQFLSVLCRAIPIRSCPWLLHFVCLPLPRSWAWEGASGLPAAFLGRLPAYAIWYEDRSRSRVWPWPYPNFYCSHLAPRCKVWPTLFSRTCMVHSQDQQLRSWQSASWISHYRLDKRSQLYLYRVICL